MEKGKKTTILTLIPHQNAFFFTQLSMEEAAARQSQGGSWTRVPSSGHVPRGWDHPGQGLNPHGHVGPYGTRYRSAGLTSGSRLHICKSYCTIQDMLQHESKHLVYEQHCSEEKETARSWVRVSLLSTQVDGEGNCLWY